MWRGATWSAEVAPWRIRRDSNLTPNSAGGRVVTRIEATPLSHLRNRDRVPTERGSAGEGASLFGVMGSSADPVVSVAPIEIDRCWTTRVVEISETVRISVLSSSLVL